MATEYKYWRYIRLSPDLWDIVIQRIGPRDFPQLKEVVVEQGVLTRQPCQLIFPPPMHCFLGTSLLSFIITAPSKPSDASTAHGEENVEDKIDAEELINLCSGLSTRSPKIQNLRIALTKFGDQVAPLLSNDIPNLSHLTIC